jgi:hypothetical protein
MAEVILKQTEVLDRLGEENVLEMEKGLEQNPKATEPVAIPRKIKRKLTLKKFETPQELPAATSPITQEVEVKPEEKQSEPVEVSEFKIIGEPMKLKIKRGPKK